MVGYCTAIEIASVSATYFVTRSINSEYIASAVIAVCNALGVGGTMIDPDYASEYFFER